MSGIAVGIVGTAKNTGKTTTTIALLNSFYDRGIQVGITSIGFDGETVDNVTGLPKPRLFVRRGVLAVTAEKCLESGSAAFKILDRLDINTPLGRLVCGRVEREGLVVLAGPNRRRYVREVIDYLRGRGNHLVIVDGALNRIVPMAETDGLVLATGGAYNREIPQIALNARRVDAICNGPGSIVPPGGVCAAGRTAIWDGDGQVLAETAPSLLEPEQLLPLAEQAGLAKGFYSPGVVTAYCLQQLLQIPFPPDTDYIFPDPARLIVGGDLETVNRFIDTVVSRGGRAGYYKPLPLLAVTVNPFYPGYRCDTRLYQPAYVDREELLRLVSAMVKVPVFDVALQGGEELAALLLDKSRARCTSRG